MKKKTGRVKRANDLFMLATISIIIGMLGAVLGLIYGNSEAKMIAFSGTMFVVGFIIVLIYTFYASDLQRTYVDVMRSRQQRKFEMIMNMFVENDMEGGSKLFKLVESDLNNRQIDVILSFVCGNYLGSEDERIRQIGRRLFDYLIKQ